MILQILKIQFLKNNKIKSYIFKSFFIYNIAVRGDVVSGTVAKNIEKVKKNWQEKLKKYDFSKPQKKVEVLREFNCDICFTQNEYLYLPAKIIPVQSPATKSGTIMTKIPPRIVCDNCCPVCGASLKKQLKKIEPGAKWL